MELSACTPAVDHVHHGHRQDVGVRPRRRSGTGAARVVRRGPGHGQRHAQHGVGPQPPLGRSPVEVDQGQVDPPLVEGVEARQDLGDLAVDVLDGPEDTLAPVALPPVAPLGGLVGRRSTPPTGRWPARPLPSRGRPRPRRWDSRGSRGPPAPDTCSIAAHSPCCPCGWCCRSYSVTRTGMRSASVEGCPDRCPGETGPPATEAARAPTLGARRSPAEHRTSRRGHRQPRSALGRPGGRRARARAPRDVNRPASPAVPGSTSSRTARPVAAAPTRGRPPVAAPCRPPRTAAPRPPRPRPPGRPTARAARAPSATCRRRSARPGSSSPDRLRLPLQLGRQGQGRQGARDALGHARPALLVDFLSTSQSAATSSAVSATASPKTCGWRTTSLSCTPRATSASVNRPSSAASTAWK